MSETQPTREFARPEPFHEAEVRYTSPAKQAEQGEDMPVHLFELVVEGQTVGGAEVEYLSRPLPLYQLSELWVDYEHQGKGGASRLMDQIEQFLRDRHKPGVLVEAMINEHTEGMYAKRGWQPVEYNPGMHVYNWPDDLPLEVLRGYSQRGTDPQDRPGWDDKELFT